MMLIISFFQQGKGGFQLAHIGALARGHGVDVAVYPRLVQRFYVLRDVLLGHNVRLCIGDEHRDAERPVLFYERDVAFGYASMPVVHKENDVHALCRRLRRLHHHVGEVCLALVYTGRIHEHELIALRGEYAHDRVARGLRFGRDY